MFTVVLPDIIRRICELSHVWGKKSAIQTYQNSSPKPPSMSQSIIRLTPVPSGALKLSEKDFFSFLQINNITNIGWSQPRKKS